MGRAKKLGAERLPQKLKHIRESFNLSQNQLLIKLGVEDLIYQGNISEYESGKRQPPIPIILAYSKLIGVCSDYLIDDSLELPEKLPSEPKHKK